MTEEEKKLLLKDLCARLPYGVKAYIEHDTFYDEIEPYDGMVNTNTINDLLHNEKLEVRPYLRPLSSMMQGEWEEMTALIYPYGRVNLNNKNELLLWLSVEGNDMPIMLMDNVFSWLNEHNFDYRELIEKGLSLEAPKGMYN